MIDLHEVRFEAPDGSEMTRDVVRHPGAVSVVPLFESGDVVLVRQFRAPLGREMLEIPAGNSYDAMADKLATNVVVHLK